MRAQTSSKGNSLLEVLIALIILAIGLLGLAGMQLHGLRDNHSAFLRSQATYLAAEIIDRMQANREAALAGEYDIESEEEPTGASSKALTDLEEWKANLATLPEGDGSVKVVDGTASVTVKWRDMSSRGNATSFQTDVRI
jgi:type IV pilus assembly protein PilV